MYNRTPLDTQNWGNLYNDIALKIVEKYQHIDKSELIIHNYTRERVRSVTIGENNNKYSLVVDETFIGYIKSVNVDFDAFYNSCLLHLVGYKLQYNRVIVVNGKYMTYKKSTISYYYEDNVLQLITVSCKNMYKLYIFNGCQVICVCLRDDIYQIS
jgi:hypothetical protein